MYAYILSFLKYELHIIALAIMFTVYVAKVIWILRFEPMLERTPEFALLPNIVLNLLYVCNMK